MGKRKTNPANEAQITCSGCGKAYNPTCDWRQGRCPMHPALWTSISTYFKQLFKPKK